MTTPHPTVPTEGTDTPAPPLPFAHCVSPHVDPEPATQVLLVRTAPLTPDANAHWARAYCDLCARYHRPFATQVLTPGTARDQGWQVAS